MPIGPDVTAHDAHEERVRAFMTSLSSRRLARVEQKYPVLDAGQLRRIREEETDWDPCLLDLVEASGLPVHHSAFRVRP